MGLDALTVLLWAAQGVTARYADTLFRTAPSAGGLYPIETYLVVRAVDTLDAGVYHFRPHKFDLELLTRHGYGNLPVCIAKTPVSLSDRASLRGRPQGFRITVNELRVSAGAGFVVAMCGNIMTMPGLPKHPVAERIRVLPDGRAVGLA